jgi:hypothetical protein
MKGRERNTALAGTAFPNLNFQDAVGGWTVFTSADPLTFWPELIIGTKQREDKDALRKAASERWPELAMAHSDCYACHHDLQSPSWRQARGYEPGST